ncbi:cysteine/Histidine-rich C1 domain family protein [Striga asiatica]|uniref:Cysteine/Histidine-rich C1 domain family protein n=1 Tax=Striga asiatica TaxID=4170 RepID=A0A5A7QBZ1_STRAF|nr:cysteine/Histidine-rich C1 domain family protein [Striga asiatica]
MPAPPKFRRCSRFITRSMVDVVEMDTVWGREIRLLSIRHHRYESWSLEASTDEPPYNEICRASGEVRLRYPHQSRHSVWRRKDPSYPSVAAARTLMIQSPWRAENLVGIPRDLCGSHSRRGWLFRQIPDGFDIADLMELPKATSEVPNCQKAKTRFILLRPLQPRPCRREPPGMG